MKSAGRHRGSGRAAADPDRDGRSGALIIADAISPFCGIGCVMFALVAGAQVGFDATAGSAASSTLAAGSAVILGAVLYRITDTLANIPMILTPTNLALVLALNLTAAFGSGLLTLGKLRRADPADLF